MLDQPFYSHCPTFEGYWISKFCFVLKFDIFLCTLSNCLSVAENKFWFEQKTPPRVIFENQTLQEMLTLDCLGNET